MNLNMEKLRSITEPNKDIYRNRLAEIAFMSDEERHAAAIEALSDKDNLYNRGFRDGYNAKEKEIADRYARFMEMNFSKKEEANDQTNT